MWKPTYHPGPWQQYLNRKDNIGLPLMEVRRKYLTEQLQFENWLTSQPKGRRECWNVGDDLLLYAGFGSDTSDGDWDPTKPLATGLRLNWTGMYYNSQPVWLSDDSESEGQEYWYLWWEINWEGATYPYPGPRWSIGSSDDNTITTDFQSNLAFYGYDATLPSIPSNYYCPKGIYRVLYSSSPDLYNSWAVTSIGVSRANSGATLS